MEKEKIKRLKFIIIFTDIVAIWEDYFNKSPYLIARRNSPNETNKWYKNLSDLWQTRSQKLAVFALNGQFSASYDDFIVK